jgi:hypothetical protein
VYIKSTNLGDIMSKSLAVAISVGILAAVWNALSGDYLGSIVATSIPVGFIAWACSSLAGKSDAMQKTVIGMTFGAIVASVAVIIGGFDLPVIGASDEVGVGLAALILVLVSGRVSQVSNVGINVLGFASAFTLSPNETSIAAMDLSNPVVIVLVSSILGVVAGNLAGRLAAAIK